MVRTYKKTSGTRNYKNYTEEAMEEAIEIITNNELCINASAIQYKIPFGTLYNKYKGLHGRTPGAQPVFMHHEEIAIIRAAARCGNWVEDRIECLKDGTLYFPPKDEIDYIKMKPESRQANFRQNKLNSTQSNFSSIIRHDSHDSCDNYATTNDLVYHHLPKPLCGPNQRYYKRAQHQFYPQPDLMECYGNVTEWGLRKYLEYEWKCTDVSDYISSLYDDTFVPPRPHQYLQRKERRGRNSSFTKSFCFKMTKSKQ